MFSPDRTRLLFRGDGDGIAQSGDEDNDLHDEAPAWWGDDRTSEPHSLISCSSSAIAASDGYPSGDVAGNRRRFGG
jgi:hypothetical protein